MKLCVLELIGVNEQGQKKLLAISDGVRESTQSWQVLLLDLKERSFNAPKVALGDGAAGLWRHSMKCICKPASSDYGYTRVQRAQLATEFCAAEREE